MFNAQSNSFGLGRPNTLHSVSGTDGSDFRAPEIPSRIGVLEGNVERLHETIGTLMSRLSPALNSNCPPEGEGGLTATPETELGVQLGQINARVLRATEYIESILRRLEI